MSTKEAVSTFYNDYTNYQLREEVLLNDRHFILYEKLRELGVKPHNSILELGCGIGVITSLMSTLVPQGSITACDISEKSIELAKQNVVNQQNIKFIASDIQSLSLHGQKFDYLTLFDVLEHIPEEDHEKIFRIIGSYMHEDSVLLINIPHPASIDHEREFHPQNLQIIDLPLMANDVINNAYKAGMFLVSFETYSIWHENDYQAIVFNKSNKFSNISTSSTRSFMQKVKRRLKKMKEKQLLNSVYRAK